MRSFGLALVGMVAAASASAAATLNPLRAAPGYTYFNKPGATLAEHGRAITECLTIAQRLHVPGGPTAIAASHGYVAILRLEDWQNSIFIRANLERCMLVRGWRVVRIDPGEGADLEKQGADAIGARLAPWIGQATPPGDVIRTFGEGEPAAHVGSLIERSRSLSLATMLDAPLALDRDFRQEVVTGKSSKSELRPLPGDPPPTVPDGKALVVLQLSGRRADGYSAINFTRMAETREAFTGEKPGEEAPWFKTPFPKSVFKGEAKSSARFILAVEPGWWVVAGAGNASTCLKAPSVQLKAGDVVYLGDFDLDDPLRPNLDPAAARTALSSRPALAEKLQRAEWRNGASWTCRALIIGGYEILGAPASSP